MSIEYKINISRQKSHNSLIDDLGVIAEVVLHSLSSVCGVYDRAVLHYRDSVFLDYANDVISAVVSLLDPA